MKKSKRKSSKRSSTPEASRPYMPGYEMMFRKGRGRLPWTWAVDRLSKARNYWVATVRPDRHPHVMTVWGLWLNDTFYFSTGPRSRKARNLAKNPSCAICPEYSGAGVVVEGTAKKVSWSSLPRDLAGAYRRKYKWDLDPDQGPVYAVRPSKVFGFVEEAEGSSGNPTRWTFPE